MKKKLCCILMLIVLLLNSSLMLIVSEAVEAVQTAVEKAEEADKRQAINELTLTKYENFDTTVENGQEDKSGSKGTLVQFNLKTGLKLAEGVDYVPFKQTIVNIDLPWVGDYKPSRVEVITKSTQATNGGKSAKYEYHASTGILTITAENKDYKDNVADARDEYDIICIYREECYSATNEERDLKVRANVEITLNDEKSTKVLAKAEKEGKVTEKIGNVISAEYETENVYNGYIEANGLNENNKYETIYKEVAKIQISNKDLAQNYMMTWVNKFENDKQELDDTSMLTYKETNIDKAKFINTFGEKSSLDILNNEGKVLKTINKDTEADENGKITIKYENSIPNVIIKLTGIEKEGTIEFENTKCISSNMKDLTYNKINTYMIAQGYNTIQVQQENAQSKTTEDKKVYQVVEKNTTQIKNAISNIETKLDNKTWVNNAANEVTLTAILKTNTSKDSLFKNPTIVMELPSEVEETIITEPYLMYNNLKFEIVESKVIVNEKKNKAIKITLKGSQESYEQNTIAGGINVVVPLKVYLRKSMESVEATIKTTYTNENTKETIYSEQGKEYDELKISLVNKIVVATPVLYSADQNYVQVIEKDGIRIEISRKVGNQYLPEEGIVYEQQIISNTVKITNNNTASKSVKLAIDIPDEMTWVVLNQKDCEYNENAGYYKRYAVYEYNEQSEKQLNINLNELKAGESIAKSFDLRIDDLADTEESKTSSVDYQMVIDATQYTFSNKLVVKQAEIKTDLIVTVGTGKNDWIYRLTVKNISNKDLKNVDLTFEASAFFEISGTDDNYGSFDGNIWRHTLTQLAKDEEKTIWISGDVNEYSEDNGYEYQLKAIATAKASNIYLSNETAITGYKEGVEVSMTSNKEEQKLRQDEEIEYTINIKNVGKTREWYATYTKVNIKDFMSEELAPVSVSYNDFSLEVTEVQDEEEAQLKQKVEKITETQKDEEIALIDKEAEDVADMNKDLIIPFGKTVTLKLKAKARMIYETKDATNKITVSGEDIKTKTASLTNTVVKYDEPENPDPEEPDKVKVTGITLNNTNLTLKVGESQKLIATIFPENADNKNIIWTSGNYLVAEVDTAGNITAKSAGKTTITATTEDEAKVAICNIVVINDNVDPNPEPEEVAVTGVYISNQSINLKINESEQLYATVMPENATNKNVTWSSADREIAEVDENGYVTAKSAGTTTITVTTEDGKMTASCKVTVKKEEEEPNPGTIGVEGITLNVRTMRLKIDESKELIATVVPENATNKNVIWSSSSPVVASVDENGKVTGKSEGTANIMATTEDGGITVSCRVTVTQNSSIDDESVESVVLDLQAMKLEIGASRTLQATVLPENAINKNVKWTSNNTEVATVDQNGKVTAKSVGVAIITVTTEDGGKTAYCTVTVSQKDSNPDNPTPDETITISGVAWIDENEDGKRDDEEKLYSNMDVLLYDYSAQKLIYKDGVAIRATTNEKGEYEFTNIAKGEYIVVFLYDNTTYSLTEYQKQGVSSTKNSDAIEKNVLLEGKETIAGLTDTLIAKSTLKNIDIGVIKNKSFDMELQKYINKITVQTKKGTKTYNYNNKKLAKVEINSKYLNGATVVLEYKMVVTNKGELAGKVGMIVDNIPEGLEFHSELNPNWYEKDGKLYTIALSGEKIGAGESREVTIVFAKTMNSNNVGKIENIANIDMSSNDKAVEDSNKENDTSKVEVIIGLTTGVKQTMIIIAGGAAIIGIIALVIIGIKKNKAFRMFAIVSLICIVGGTGIAIAYYDMTETSSGRPDAYLEHKGESTSYSIYAYDVLDDEYKTATLEYGPSIKGHDTAPKEDGYVGPGIGNTSNTTSGHIFTCKDPGAPFPNVYVPCKFVEFTPAAAPTYQDVNVPRFTVGRDNNDMNQIEYYNNGDSYNTIGPFDPHFEVNHDDYMNTEFFKFSYYVTIDYMTKDGAMRSARVNDSDLVTADEGVGIARDHYTIEEPTSPSNRDLAGPFYIKISKDIVYVTRVNISFRYETLKEVKVLIGTTIIADINRSSEHQQMKRETGGEDLPIVVRNKTVRQASVEWNGPWRAPTSLVLEKKDKEWAWSGSGGIPMNNVEFLFLRGRDVNSNNYLKLTDLNGNKIERLSQDDTSGWIVFDKIMNDGETIDFYNSYEPNNENSNKFYPYYPKETIYRPELGIGYRRTDALVWIKGNYYLANFSASKDDATILATSNECNIAIGNLRWGDYTFVESKSNRYEYTQLRTKIVSGSTSRAWAENHFDVLNKRQTGNLRIYKRDTDQDRPLENVEFVMTANVSQLIVNNKDFNSEERANINGKYVVLQIEQVASNSSFEAHDLNSISGLKDQRGEAISQVRESTGTWAKRVKGIVKVSDITFTDDRDKATRLTTNKNGVIELINLLMSSKGYVDDYQDKEDQITYELHEVNSNNYGYAPYYKYETSSAMHIEAKSNNAGSITEEGVITLKRQNTHYTAYAPWNSPGINESRCLYVTIKNDKLTQNLHIFKKDYDQHDQLLPGVTFRIIAKLDGNKEINGKYIRIKASGDNVEKGADGYADKITGSARVDDKLYNTRGLKEEIKADERQIKYTTDVEQATLFVTDSSGKIEIQNLLTSLNGTNRIQYHLEEIENPNYGWVAEKPEGNPSGNYNNYTVTFSATNGATMSTTAKTGYATLERGDSKETDKKSGGAGAELNVYNMKQTTNILIDKTDYDNHNKKLENVVFVLKAQRDKDISHPENPYKYLPVSDSTKYVQIKTEAGWQEGTTLKGSVRAIDIKYVDYEEATRFATDSSGKIEIHNILMSTNGADKIYYHLEEISNPNYGWVAESPYGNPNGNYNNYTVTFDTRDFANGDGTVTNNGITSDLDAITLRGWAKPNRQKSQETDRTRGGSGLDISVRNWKQTTNILIDKTDTDQNDVKLSNVTFVLKAKRNKDVTHPDSKYKNIDNKYVRIKTSENGTWVKEVRGSVRIVDIDYVSDFNQATKFVTDDDGKLAIKNILISTNGDDRIYYHLEEISNPNYGWVAEKSVGNPNGNYNNYTVTFETEDEYTSEDAFGEGDGTVTNNNSTDISSESGIKARGWVKANRQPSTQTEANGTAGIDVSVRNLKETANILIDKTDSLLTNKKLANVTFVLKAKKDKEISHPENKYKDISGKYVRIKTKEDGDWEKEVRGSVRIVDIDYVTDMKDATIFVTDDNGRLEIHNILISTNGADKIWYHLEELSNPNYGWVAEKGNYNNYTVHFTTKDNANGDGTVTDNNSTDISSEGGLKARGWTKPNRQKSQETDKTTGGSGLDVNVLNVKQTSNLFIEKVDSRNTNKKLPNVSFVLKAQRDKDISHAENRYKNIDNKYVRIKTSDNGDWEKEVTGTVYIKDIDYVSSIDDATVFITGEQGKLEIYNLLMSTNGADIIKYHIEEIKNENYGYLSDDDKYKNFRVTFGSNAPNGWVTLTRLPSTETENTSSKKGENVQVKNEQMYMRASGYVWEDIADGKSNSIDSLYKEASDALVKGIRVHLHKIDGNNDSIIATALTDENGYYEFGTKIVNGKKYINGVLQPGTFDHGYENKDYWSDKEPSVNGNNFTSKPENENGNLVIQDLDKYYIEFEYDGLKFTTVATKWNYSNRDDEASKAAEVPTNGSKADGSTKNRDRQTVNNDFAEIWQKRSTGYGLSYVVNKEEHIATYTDKWAYKYENNSSGKKILNITDASLNKNHEYAVVSTTKQSGYSIAQKWKTAYQNTGLECITNNNQGIFRREQADNAISEDIDSVDVIVNGYKNTYQYGGRKEYQKEGDVEETSDGFGVAVKFGNKNNSSQYSNRGLNTYQRPLYESDLAWHLADPTNNVMEVYVTYKIVVKNQSDTLTTSITELANYFDRRYTLVQSWIGDNTGNRVNWSSNGKGRGDYDSHYSTEYTSGLNLRLEPGKTSTVYVKFKLNDNALQDIAHEKTTLMNVVEISAFTSYYGNDTIVAGVKTAKTVNDGVNNTGKIYAAIDKDSAPLDAKVGATGSSKEQTITRPDGSTLKYYDQNLELTDKGTFEDDTDFAPSLILGIDETDPTRAISGIVWEDATTEEKVEQTNRRIGDGIYQNNEKLVENAQINLVKATDKKLGNPEDTDNSLATVYRLEVTGNNSSSVKAKADKARVYSAKTLSTPVRTGYNNQDAYKYNWIIIGVIPDENYKLRYAYGTFDDGKVSMIEGNEVDAREYKSTIVVASPMLEELQKATGENGGTPNKNWVIDNANKQNSTRSNVAIDADLKLREESDNIYYGSYIQKIKMFADSAIFDIKVENNSHVKVDQSSNPKNTSSKYDDEFKLVEENGKKTVKRVSTYYSVIPFMDFGITLRPKQKLDLDKTISNLAITLANGQNIIYGNPYTDRLNYVKALKNESYRRVLAEMDNEIIEGATVKIEYEITITNYSEIDYDYRDYTGYYYWGKENDDYILKNVVNSVGDYMTGGIQDEEEKNVSPRNPADWKKRALEYLTGEENGKRLINDDVENGIKSFQKDNNIVILESQNIGDIEPPQNYGEAGGSTTLHLYGSKLLAVDETGVKLINDAEILGTFKKISDKTTGKSAIPGNRNPADADMLVHECDDSRIEFIITPPTGLSAKELRELEAKEQMKKIFSPMTILKGGYCLIKKQILEK